MATWGGGVRQEPLFDCVEVDHYVIPVLHLTIGKGNDVLEHLMEEMQAAAEEYSQEYLDAEKAYEQARQVHSDAGDDTCL